MTMFNDELDTEVFHTILNSFHSSHQFAMEQKNNFIFFWMSWYKDLILSLLHLYTVKLYFQVCILLKLFVSLEVHDQFGQELSLTKN